MPASTRRQTARRSQTTDNRSSTDLGGPSDQLASQAEDETDEVNPYSEDIDEDAETQGTATIIQNACNSWPGRDPSCSKDCTYHHVNKNREHD